MSETITAPVVETVAVAPVADVAPVAPVVADVAPAAEVAPVAPAPEPTAPAPTALGDAPPPPVAPVEPTLAPEPAKVEGQSDEPAPPPTYDPFDLPEGVTLLEDRTNEFTGLLGEFETVTKADHAQVQAFGQKLITRHIAEVNRVVEGIQKQAVEAMETQKQAWTDQLRQDPEVGGNRFQTAVDSARQFIMTHGGNDEQQAEFRTLMNETGLGNHPALVRIFAKAGMVMAEGRPLAARPAPMPQSKTQKLYGRS